MSIYVRSNHIVHIGRAATAVAPVLMLLACSSAQPGAEHTASSGDALTQADAGATITISGTVTDPIDGPQAGITITLSGSAQGQIATDFSGSFKFNVTPGGSYSLTAAGNNNFFQPPFHSCLTVTPSIVNLNNLTASTTINFVGSGTDPFYNCSPAASTGAASGSLTIKGSVTSGGKPVAGARVLLNGSTQGYRTSDETGAYSFSVNPGSYSVNASGTCATYTPNVTNLNNLKTSTTLNIQGTNCPPAPLALCPAFDALLGLTEPASCNTVSTATCANDRIFTWAGEMAFDFQTDNDCRFGKWQVPPIVNDFSPFAFNQQNVALNIFTLQLMGCALANNLTGPLNLQGTVIPTDLVRAGLTFTTADIAALEDDMMAAINEGLTDFGVGPLTAAQSTAIRAQLDYAASKVTGVVASSKLTYSTCP